MINVRQIWVITKITRTCNSNTGKKDFIGVLPFFGLLHIPSETVFGGAAKQSWYKVSLNCVTKANKVLSALNSIMAPDADPKRIKV